MHLRAIGTSAKAGSISTALTNILALWPGREALVDGEKRFTYREFAKRVDSLAEALSERGVAVGTVVAVIAPNGHEFMEAYYACALIGAVCNPINFRLSAQEIALRAHPREDAFVCAIGAFTPAMVEWAPNVCQYVAEHGKVVVDTRDADHEAGDLLQAGLDVTLFPSLQDVVRGQVVLDPARLGPVFFKSCGWAGWDLAAARCVLQSMR